MRLHVPGSRKDGRAASEETSNSHTGTRSSLHPHNRRSTLAKGGSIYWLDATQATALFRDNEPRKDLYHQDDI